MTRLLLAFRKPNLDNTGSVSPPHTIVVNITIVKVVDIYKSLLSLGIFCDNAKAIAPLNPANHIAHFIRNDILCFLNIFAIYENGNVFNILDIKHKIILNIINKIFHFLNLPVKKPIPIYRYTKNSDNTANDLNK